MPIRFRCAHCNKLLGIATRKAGTVVDCPECSRPIQVPQPQPESAPAGREGTDGPGVSPAAAAGFIPIPQPVQPANPFEFRPPAAAVPTPAPMPPIPPAEPVQAAVPDRLFERDDFDLLLEQDRTVRGNPQPAVAGAFPPAANPVPVFGGGVAAPIPQTYAVHAAEPVLAFDGAPTAYSPPPAPPAYTPRPTPAASAPRYAPPPAPPRKKRSLVSKLIIWFLILFFMSASFTAGLFVGRSMPKPTTSEKAP